MSLLWFDQEPTPDQDMTKEEMINKQVFQFNGYPIKKSLSLEDSVHSLIYITTLKPQYKIYCDLVEQTQQIHPSDEDEFEPVVKPDNNKKQVQKLSWFTKVKVFLCCKPAGKLADETELQQIYECDTDHPCTPDKFTNYGPSENYENSTMADQVSEINTWRVKDLEESKVDKRNRLEEQSFALSFVIFISLAQLFVAVSQVIGLQEFT